MSKELTFSQLVKEELSGNTYSLVRKKALLSAFIKINGVISFVNKKDKISLRIESGKVARFIYESLVSIYDKDLVHLSFTKNRRNNTIYVIEIIDAEALSEDLHISFIENKISRELVYNDDTIAGYLAGAFLASGSINSPKKSNYHLEIVVNEENYAKWFAKLFVKYRKSNIEAKITVRRNKYVIYLKASALIADFLIMIGAVNSCLEFENERINRDFVNNSNRLNNIDTANMAKTIESGKKQLKDIALIEEKFGLNYLKKDKLILAASLRKEYESASLEEIADMMSEKLGYKITKSNVNHLFRRIHIIAEKC